jgi:hypothetical protein
MPLLDHLDERAKVDTDRVIGDRDAFPGLPGQGRDQCLMSRPVRSHPGVRESVTGDHVANLGSYEALDSVGQRSGECVQSRCDARRQAAGGQGIHRLIGECSDVQVAKDLGRDLVRDGILDRRITRERCHGGHVTIGIGDQVLRPDGDYRERRQDAAGHDQQGGDHRAPALPTRMRERR